MATLRQLRNRVTGVKNIQKVTHAMQLVAAARVRKAQDAILAARPYAEQLDRILQRLTACIDADRHPLFRQGESGRVAIAVVTADRGLCGGFNAGICRRVLAELQEHAEVELIAVGRKGRDFFRQRGLTITREYLDVFAHLDLGQAVSIARDMTSRFMSGDVDQVWIANNEFLSLGRQEPAINRLLPIVPQETEEKSAAGEYIFEPDPEQLLETLVPRHVNFQVWRALLESNAGEQAARMAAMDNATKNAGDLIEELTREMNKVRQSSITLELMDIIGGAEAVA
ncbi:MAG: ATP synthase F1 subunit gamma [Gemmatimonadota bacterium]|nr:ATP synthase F1 subunit gamma [Gemmatimonadota bacterium]